MPRMTFDEYFFFKTFLSKNTNALYLESGSGGSTLIADDLFDSFISYETDKNYTNYMNQLLNADIVSCIKVGETGKFGLPVVKSQGNATKISTIFNTHLKDKKSEVVVFLDGRCRIATAPEIHSLVTDKDSVLIHDFERPHYQRILEVYDAIDLTDRLVVLKKKKVTEKVLDSLKKEFATDFR